jgi:hypothetical protein
MTNPQRQMESPRTHPDLADLFRRAEGRHLTDAELDKMLDVFPALDARVAAAREIREKETALIGRCVKEIYALYPYERHHEHATAKCVRDVRYVVAYATHAMLADDMRWFEDKLLIWMKTILQAFDFPAPAPDEAIFAAAVEPGLAEKLKTFSGKTQSIYHMYWLVRREAGKDLRPEHFRLLSPHLELAMNVLSEKY